MGLGGGGRFYFYGREDFSDENRGSIAFLFRVSFWVFADVWEKDVGEFQAKSGSSGSGRLFLLFLGKIAVPEMSGKAPGSPRHPSSRHLRSSDLFKGFQTL